MGHGCFPGIGMKKKGGRGGKKAVLSVKVVLADGEIEEFTNPITVAELMVDHPQHYVLHSSDLAGKQFQKKAILPADVELEPGRLYYLVPSSKFAGCLSPPKNVENDVKEATHTDSKRWEPRSSTGQKLITRDDLALSKDTGLEEEEEEDCDSHVTLSTPDLRSMYANQQNLLRCHSWKPRLETINEVGALSRKKFQSLVRGRGSLSQVHNYLSS